MNPLRRRVNVVGVSRVQAVGRDDFADQGVLYDAIFDVACKKSFSRSIKSLKSNGIYVIGNPRLNHMFRGFWIDKFTSKTVTFEFAPEKNEDLIHLMDLIAEGKLKTHIDKVYPLEQLAEAHEHMESGKRKGHTLITIN